jgi:monoamine oxidase
LASLAYGDFARTLEGMTKKQVINKAESQLQKMVPTIREDDAIDMHIIRWTSIH